jgi:2-keto-4-pentenoate hydratase
MLMDQARYAPGMNAQLAAMDDAGMARCGWKVGINVPEVLAQLGLCHSAVGWLNGQRRYRSGDLVPSLPGSKLHVEPELCLKLSHDVRSAMAPGEAFRCIDAVAPALELVDYALPRGGLDEIVAHSMFHHGFVLGGWRSPDAAADLGSRWPTLEVAGVAAPPPRSDLVPRSLEEIVLFVASFLEAFGRSPLAGDLILSGSYLPTAIEIRPGGGVHADYGPLGDVGCRVAVT